MPTIDFKDHTQFLLDIEGFPTDINTEQQKPLHLYKLIQSVNSACNKNVNVLKKLLSKHTTLEKVEALKLILDSECNGVFSTPKCTKINKTSIISSLLNLCYEECSHDNNEALFFAAATFKISRLKEVIKESTDEEINQTRYSDSVIIFTLKYGDVRNKNFLECMNTLIDAGVDINKSDASGKFAIDYVAILYKHNKDINGFDDLKKVGKLLLCKRICEPEDTLTKTFIEKELDIDLAVYRYAKMEYKEKVFFWIAKYKIKEFLNCKKVHQFANCDNGENTLLQYAVNKSEKMLPIVEFLLKNGADPNKVTKINTLSPLELAARNNYETIFKVLINWKTTTISQKQFANFVKWRGYSIKREFFGYVLESEKLDPTFTFQKSGNTPLHYAIRLCHKNAILKLLKRPDVSLTVRNIAGKCPLDILNPTDLSIYLDSCLVFDSRKTIDFNSTEYTMQFRFRRLTDGNLPEVDVISLIGKYQHLEHILAHPLIHTYVMLKWFKVKCYFWTTLLFQALLFLILSVLFYRYPYSSPTEHAICLSFSLVNIVTKCWVFLRPKDILHKLVSFCMKTTTLHESSEILLMISLIGSFCLTEFRAFVFIEMAIVFLLTAGYHPKLAHWSIMLQAVFRTFIKLLIFFSILMIAFAAGFHIMFEDHRFFTFLYRSVFMSYFMTIGEINVSEVDFETTSFGGYLLFFLFAMSMSVVIINFWTGVAIRDIDKFEKRSEVNALKNVIAFITFVEKNLYSVRCLRKILPNPLLFPEVKDETYIVNFYVNKDDQFEYKYVYDEEVEVQKKKEERNFPKQINKLCYNKIRAHYEKLQNNTNEQKILIKLDKILQQLEVRNESGKQKRVYKRQNSVM